MRAKAIRDLSQLEDNELFEQTAKGLELIIENASRIEADARFLAEQQKSCGYKILHTVAQEEAAKFLILLDAIRCPRIPDDDFVKQLSRFDDHLARGLYAFYYELTPSQFGDVRKIVERECREYYLDRPDDIDWIFRNEILQGKEETIRVDYIERDGKHTWLSPQRYYHPELANSLVALNIPILEVAKALLQVGCAKPRALAVIAEKWRSIPMTNDFSWTKLRDLNYETLKDLHRNKLLAPKLKGTYSTVVDRWLFPLYSLDLRLIKVDKSKLREINEREFFDFNY
jgi:AbiV family abortive infection protein